MADTGGSGTPAAWYPDPAGSGQQRYWDGSAWTEHYAPGPAGQQGPSMRGDLPVTAVAPPFTAGGPVYPPAYASAAPSYPGPATPPPTTGMSGCLKAFLVVLALSAVLGVVGVSLLLYLGGRVVHHISTTITPIAGRPSSLPSGDKDYGNERKQDHVAGSDGKVTVGTLDATATGWARTTGDTGAKLICGKVSIDRATVTAKDPFGAALQLAGDFAWELVRPSGATDSYDPSSSSLTALNDYLTTDHTGSATGQICFADPGGSGQFAITWQPRLLRAERAVWIVKLS